MINPYSDSIFNSDLNNDYSQSHHSNTWDSGIDSSFNSDLHSHDQDYHNPYSSNTWDSGLDSNSYHHDVNNYDYNHYDHYQSNLNIDSSFNSDLDSNDQDYHNHYSSNTWDSGLDSNSYNHDVHNYDYNHYDHYQSNLNTNINQDSHQTYHSNAWDAGINSHGYHSSAVYNSDNNHRHVLTPDSNNGIDFSVTQNVVLWHGNSNYAGEIKGNSFYDSHGDLLGHLGADMKIYDAHNVARGYVTPNGCAYDNSGHLFASGGTSQWAAATYVYNTFSPA